MASPAFNRVIIMGNLTADPELRYTPQGTAVCDFTVAVNEKYKDKQTASFIGCTAWGSSAENLCKYQTKGACVHVEGKLAQESWEDKTSGQKRTKTKVTVQDIRFISSKKRDGAADDEPRVQQPAGGEDFRDEDVPF